MPSVQGRGEQDISLIKLRFKFKVCGGKTNAKRAAHNPRPEQQHIPRHMNPRGRLLCAACWGLAQAAWPRRTHEFNKPQGKLGPWGLVACAKTEPKSPHMNVSMNTKQANAAREGLAYIWEPRKAPATTRRCT